MKTTRALILGLTLCGATMFLASCDRSGGGDEHNTQNENIGNGSTENDMSGDTTSMGDTATTM